MAKKQQKTPDSRAFDFLTDQSQSFEITGADGEKKILSLHPLQLGRLALISKRLLDLDLAFDEEKTDAVQKMWKICSEKPRQVAEIIAIATLKTKQEIDDHFEARTDELMWSPTMTPQAYANLLYTIVVQSYYADFTNAIRSVRTLRETVSQPTAAERIALTEGEAFGGQ